MTRSSRSTNKELSKKGRGIDEKAEKGRTTTTLFSVFISLLLSFLNFYFLPVCGGRTSV